jgi:hypothetical protein
MPRFKLMIERSEHRYFEIEAEDQAAAYGTDPKTIDNTLDFQAFNIQEEVLSAEEIVEPA